MDFQNIHIGEKIIVHGTWEDTQNPATISFTHACGNKIADALTYTWIDCYIAFGVVAGPYLQMAATMPVPWGMHLDCPAANTLCNNGVEHHFALSHRERLYHKVGGVWTQYAVRDIWDECALPSNPFSSRLQGQYDSECRGFASTETDVGDQISVCIDRVYWALWGYNGNGEYVRCTPHQTLTRNTTLAYTICT